jgi:hypothetical protein
MGVTIRKPTKPLNLIIIDVLDKMVAVRGKEELENLANDVRQKLVDKIQDDSFNFPAFAKKYADRKDREHPGEPPLVATEEYINSIQVRPAKNGFTVGVGDEVHMGETGHPIQMNKLANILEYGWPEKNIAPRPHWRPTLENLKRRTAAISKEMRHKLNKDIQAAFREYLSQGSNFETKQHGK